MCGTSDFKINDDEWDITLGYWGGMLSITNEKDHLNFSADNKEMPKGVFGPFDILGLSDFLHKYSYEDLIDIIIQIIKNAEEG